MKLKRKKSPILATVLIYSLLTGCTFPSGSRYPTETPQPSSTSQPTAAATASPSPTATLMPTAVPSPTTTNTPWSEEIYPQALSKQGEGAWQATDGCPNPKGLQDPMDSLPSDELIATLMTELLSGDELRAKKVSDRALWPVIPKPTQAQVVTVDWIKNQGPARDAGFAGLVKGHCGEDTLAKSWWVNLCAGPCGGGGFLAIETHAFLILRNQQWLVWAIQ